MAKTSIGPIMINGGNWIEEAFHLSIARKICWRFTTSKKKKKTIAEIKGPQCKLNWYNMNVFCIKTTQMTTKVTI